MRRNRKVLGLTQYLRKQEGLEPLPVGEEWPPHYSFNGRRVLDRRQLESLFDSTGELDSAFSWSSTPQGHDHWAVRNDGEYLSTEDIDYIQYLVEEHT